MMSFMVALSLPVLLASPLPYERLQVSRGGADLVVDWTYNGRSTGGFRSINTPRRFR